MTKEELEKDYYADRPTEPYSDDDSANDWANIAHYAEENLEKAFNRIAELEEKNERLKGDLELWESGACRATNIDKCGVVKELEAQKKELQCCANCRYSYGGEEEPHHDCGYCHTMQCICKLKLEEHTSDIYRMWEDKCERWEMRLN